METIAKIGTKGLTRDKAAETSSAFWDKVEYNRWGLNMIVLFTTMIAGGIAGAFALNMPGIVLAIMLTSCMFTLMMVLGLVHVKVITWTGISTVAIAVIIIIAGLIQSGGLMENW
jgi:hypothetical protein